MRSERSFHDTSRLPLLPAVEPTAAPAAPSPSDAPVLLDLPDDDPTERAAWLADRRTGIGGSDVAGVLGVSPWASPWSVWADKVGARPIDDEPSAAMEFGLLAEPMLRTYFRRRTGRRVVGAQTSLTHPDHAWARVTLDGFVDDLDGDPFESKTTGEGAWDEVPVYYQCQAQWAMWITDRPRCWFGVLHVAYGRPDFRVYEFERDDDDIAFIVDTCRRWWFDYVTTGIAPPTDDHPATLDALGDVYPARLADLAGVVDADDELAARVEALRAVKAEIARLEGLLDGHRAAIQAALGDATTLAHGVTARGKPRVIATWKPQTRTGFDLDAFRERFPHTYRRFARTTDLRVLRTPAPKP